MERQKIGADIKATLTLLAFQTTLSKKKKKNLSTPSDVPLVSLALAR